MSWGAMPPAAGEGRLLGRGAQDKGNDGKFVNFAKCNRPCCPPSALQAETSGRTSLTHLCAHFAHVQAAKAVAGVGSTGGPANDPSSDELPPMPAWQQRELAALQLAGPGASTEVTIRRVSAEGHAAEAAAGAAAGSPADARLLAALRVLCAPSEAALGGRSGAERLGRWDAPLEVPAAELAALRTLTGLCAICLSQFKGTVEDDIALLAASTSTAQQAQQQSDQQQQQQRQLTADKESAVRFRMDKKELLLEALAITSRRIKKLAPTAAAAAPGGSRGGGSSKAGGSGKAKGKVPVSKGGGKGFGKP